MTQTIFVALMAVQFHRLKISEVKKETPSTISLCLDVPEELQSTFTYKAGQYLTFKQIVNGEELRRSYSLSSGPSQNIWQVAIKEVENGRFSSFANRELKKGMELEVMAPMGNFLRVEESGHHVGIAAGSGITPVMSIMREVLEQDNRSRFTLLYGCRKEDEIIFRKDIEALRLKYAERLQVHLILSQEQVEGLGYGRLDVDRIDSLIGQGLDFRVARAIYLCGPSEMIFSLKDHFKTKAIDEERIHFELFTTPISQEEVLNDTVESSTGNLTIVHDGQQYVVPMNSEESILDLGLAQDIDLPFACQGGVCCTCRAKVTSGEVDMRQNFSLGDREVSDGYVLTCQSYSKGGNATVDFDA